MSGVGLGAALLQTRNQKTKSPRDKAPNNSVLKTTAFMGKSLSSAEKRYSNIQGEALGILHGLQMSLLCQRGEYNHRSQTTSSNL